MGSAVTLLRVYPKIGVGVYRTPKNFSKSVKWHFDRLDRSKKDLSNNMLQIDCSVEESRI